MTIYLINNRAKEYITSRKMCNNLSEYLKFAINQHIDIAQEFFMDGEYDLAKDELDVVRALATSEYNITLDSDGEQEFCYLNIEA